MLNKGDINVFGRLLKNTLRKLCESIFTLSELVEVCIMNNLLSLSLFMMHVNLVLYTKKDF